MESIKHILVPTDFGEPAERATDYALALAGKFDAKLTLMHVVYAIPTYAYADGFSWPVEELEKAAEEALATAVATVKQRYAGIESALVKGAPWQEILLVAKQRAVDLIVMGTHGHRGLSRMFLGSVAERVVRMSPVPVLTIPSAEHAYPKT